MILAIEEAQRAQQKGDYAVGAVVIKNDSLLSLAGNAVKVLQDPTLHAEIVAIRQATKKLGTRHLEDCILYTTHEPCPMCSGAAIWARMKGIVFGARMEDMASYCLENGNKNWSWRTIHIPASTIIERGEPKLFLVENFMREECKKLFHSD